MKPLKNLPFVCLAAALLTGAAGTASATVLLTDNFTVSTNVNDPNFEIGNGRQGGTLATPINYTTRFAVGGNQQQVGNSSTFPGNSNTLLLAFGGAAYLNTNFSNVTAPLSISFDGVISPNASADASNWVGMEIQNTNGATAFVNSGDFGILFRANGGTQVFDHGTATTGGTSTTTGFNIFNHYEVVLSDTAGTGTPFGTGGTQVTYYVNGIQLGTQSIAQLTNAYIGFSGTSIAGIDNLVIQTVPETSSLAIAGIASGLLCLRRRRA